MYQITPEYEYDFIKNDKKYHAVLEMNDYANFELIELYDENDNKIDINSLDDFEKFNIEEEATQDFLDNKPSKKESVEREKEGEI